MKLSVLIPEINCDETIKVIEITGLSSDSRYAKQGDLFFAMQGEKYHGLDFIKKLEEVAVSAIVYEKEYSGTISTNIPLIKVDDIQQTMETCIKRFYKDTVTALRLVGITGTEGKTSVTQFTGNILDQLGCECGMIGTNGIGTIHHQKENTHTTPDLMALYQSLQEIHQLLSSRDKAPVIMEVTSHALDQARIKFLSFDVTTFTNLARDHLDYHKTIEAYQAAKQKLFFEYVSLNSVINIDDPCGHEIFNELNERQDRVLYPYGMEHCAHPNMLRISELELTPNGIEFVLTYNNQNKKIKSHLFGHFNAYNLVAAIGNVLALGYDFDRICEIIPNINNVKGRMEAIKLQNGSVAVVDYAHKPNALLQVLKALRNHVPKGRLICVFGCGGDRDRGKRPLMAEIAENHADFVIVTNDNPRTEPEDLIADEIVSGFTNGYRDYRVILDRKVAIESALSMAKTGDIVVVAGKGHEDYQIVGTEKKHFSDIEVIQSYQALS